MDSLRKSIEYTRQKWAWLYALGRVVAGMFLWPVLATIALVLSTVLHLRTPLAHRIAAERVGALVSGLVHGELRIERFDKLLLREAVARNVSFYDAKGTRVIVADKVHLELDLPALLYGTIHIPSATLDGGTVRLIEGETGLPTMIEGFFPIDETPSIGPTINAAVENIRLQHVTVYGELLGLHGIRALNVAVEGELFATPDIEVNIKQTTGRLVEPFPFEAAIEQLSGTISTVPLRGIDLHAQVSRHGEHGAEHATADIRYATPINATEAVFDLRIHAQPTRSETLRDLGYAWAEPLATSITGDFRLHGPITDLALTAQLNSDGGVVAVDGFIADDRGVSIGIEGSDLSLQKIVANAPDLRVSGMARIELHDDQPNPLLHVELQPVLYERFAIPAFELDGSILDDGVQIDQVRATHYPGSLSGRGHVSYDGRVKAHVRGYFPSLSRDANLRRFFPDASGSLRAELDLDVDPARSDHIDVRGSLVLTDFNYGPLSAKRVELSGYARGDMHLPRVNLKAVGEEMRAEGYLLGNGNFTLKGAAPEYLASGEFQRDGQRTFHVDAKVQANHERMIVNAEQLELAVGEETWRGTIQELVLITNESVAVEMFRLASRSQRLEAKGIVRFKGDDEIDVQLQGFDVAALRAILGKNAYLQAGFLDTNLQLRGDIKHPQLLIQGAVTAATIKQVENINGLYFLTYQDGALQIDTEVDLGLAGTWTLSGSGTLDENLSPTDALLGGSYDIAVEAKTAELPVLAGLFDVVLPIEQTVMNSKLHVLGTLTQPTFETDFDFSHVMLPGMREMGGHATLNYSNGKVIATTQVHDGLGDLMQIEGNTPIRWDDVTRDPMDVLRRLPQSRWQLRASMPQRALGSLPFPVDIDPEQMPITIGGEASASRARGIPELDLRMKAGWAGELPPSSCSDNPIPTASLVAVLSDNNAVIVVKGGFNDRALLSSQVSFHWPLIEWLDGGAMPLPSDLNGYVRADVGAVERVPYACDYASGAFYARAELEHLWSNEPDIQVDVRSKVSITAERRRRRRSVLVPSCPTDPLKLAFQMRADGNWATANGEVSGCGGGDMQLTAKSPIAWIARGLFPSWDENRPLDASAIFNGIQLKPLLDRIPGVFSAEALANGRVTIRGTPVAPIFGGNVDVHDGALRLTSTGQNLSQMAGRVVLHDNWLEIQELHARDERGTVQVSGGIGFDGWSPRRIRTAIITRNFPVRREGAEMAAVTAEALLQATLDDDHIGMDVGFSSLAVLLPDDVARTLQSLDEHPDLEVVGRKQSTLLSANRDIGIRIHSARPFWVRRNDFSALVDADLNIVYLAPELAVGGFVEFNRGVFDVFGKSFNLERGSIRFDGGTDLNPELNLTAVYDPQTAGSSAVRVIVTGRLSSPNVVFSAQGCEDESGALSLLLTGRCNLSDSSSPDNNPDAQRTAFVGGLLAGVLTLGAKRELGALIPVIGIESTGQGFNQRIRAGIDADTLVPQFMRPIVRRAYVEGAVTTGSENQDGTTGPASVDFLLELYFPHNIVGAGHVTPGNNQVQWGVDVTWEP